MNLSDAKINQKCVVKNINIEDFKIKIRLMELGIVDGCEITVIKRSILKKTLLVVFCHSCFTLKENLAKEIEVEYA